MQDWKFIDLFKGDFLKKLEEMYGYAVYKMASLLLIIIVLAHLFSVGIVPSESMLPNITPKDYLLFQKHVVYQRGDVVTFDYPLNPNVKYLKRVIGLPGDEVEIKEGLVYINGKPLTEPYTSGKILYAYPLTKVPLNEYFVLGDNRNNSDDSHIWGFVPDYDMRGKAIAILMPFQRFTILKNPFLTASR